MTAAARHVPPGDPFGFAEQISALRSCLDHAAIEWVLAERALCSTRARFDAMRPRPAPLATDVDPDVQHATAEFLDAAARERDAAQRWRDAAIALVETLEGRTRKL